MNERRARKVLTLARWKIKPFGGARAPLLAKRERESAHHLFLCVCTEFAAFANQATTACATAFHPLARSHSIYFYDRQSAVDVAHSLPVWFFASSRARCNPSFHFKIAREIEKSASGERRVALASPAIEPQPALIKWLLFWYGAIQFVLEKKSVVAFLYIAG